MFCEWKDIERTWTFNEQRMLCMCDCSTSAAATRFTKSPLIN